MKSRSPLQHSIQSRLVLLAKELRVDPNLILARYANERLLHRISRSAHVDRFILKGAMLLVAWLGEMIRSTRDVDLLGFGDLSDAAVAATFAEIVMVHVEPDGVSFDPSSIAVAPIRVEDERSRQRSLTWKENVINGTAFCERTAFLPLLSSMSSITSAGFCCRS